MSNSIEGADDKLVAESHAAKTSLILGMSVFGHDSSCALLDTSSGKILYALTEERFSNVKHDGGFPVAALAKIRERIEEDKLGTIRYVALNLDSAISIESIQTELAAVIDAETAKLVFDEFIRFFAGTELLHPDFFPLNYISELLGRRGISSSTIEFIQEKISWFGNFALRHQNLKFHLGNIFPQVEIISVGHHQCHAASAFYCSGFERAAVLTLDGQGEVATASLSIASGTQIKLLTQTNWPNSLGALYMQLAWYLGFDGDDPRYLGFGDEFKVMGMGAYGKPAYIDIFRKLGYVNEDGQFEISFNNGYVELIPVEGCEGHSQPVFSKKFFENLGGRRLSTEPISQEHYDIACSGQSFLEEVAVDIARNLKKRCAYEDNICIAGGVGLNGLMNMRILQEAGFANIFIQPASGDDGTSLGAALHVYHERLAGKRCAKLKNVFLGLDYSSESIRLELQKYNLKFHEPQSIHTEMGRLLNEGLIVARYYGRGEFGPRALGHRSILANPTLGGTKDEVNAKIKHRESFRPFAPACLDDKVQEYFDISTHSPYMLLICKAKPGVRLKIPAVVHDDDTARLQSVNELENPDFHRTISEFYRISNIPVILNTSFNINGEAIVETPQDAIESFLFMGIDYLAIGPFLVSREENLEIYQRPSRAEHIRTRQSRYQERYFSPERYFWSVNNPIETVLSSLKNQADIYKKSAEERLAVIEILDVELKNKLPYWKPNGIFCKFLSASKSWLTG